jgi:hypothetical protein
LNEEDVDGDHHHFAEPCTPEPSFSQFSERISEQELPRRVSFADAVCSVRHPFSDSNDSILLCEYGGTEAQTLDLFLRLPLDALSVANSFPTFCSLAGNELEFTAGFVDCHGTMLTKSGAPVMLPNVSQSLEDMVVYRAYAKAFTSRGSEWQAELKMQYEEFPCVSSLQSFRIVFFAHWRGSLLSKLLLFQTVRFICCPSAVPRALKHAVASVFRSGAKSTSSGPQCISGSFEPFSPFSHAPPVPKKSRKPKNPPLPPVSYDSSTFVFHRSNTLSE